MESKSKIAIFTIVNNMEMFNGFKKNLDSQTDVRFELFPIMNCKGEYNSARRAFNESAKGRDFEYYFFSHPDIRFLDSLALAEIVKCLDVIDKFGVAGIAGAVRTSGGRKILTTIVQGKNKESVGEKIEKPEKVQTLDECLFIVKREYFEEHPFSALIGWHLYSVEYCLEAISNGFSNYVIPARVWHLSSGQSLDERYMSQLEGLIQKYRNRFDIICTTVKAWPTKGFLAFLYRRYYWFKQRMKRTLIQRRC